MRKNGFVRSIAKVALTSIALIMPAFAQDTNQTPDPSSTQTLASMELLNQALQSLSSELLINLPATGTYAIKSVNDTASGVPEDLLIQISSNLQASLLSASKQQVKIIDQSQLKGAWRDAIEFNGADFEALVSASGFDALIILQTRATERGIDLSLQAIGAGEQNPGAVIASAKTRSVSLNWKELSGIDVENVNEQIDNALQEISELKLQIEEQGRAIKNPKTYVENYANGLYFQEKGDHESALNSFRSAVGSALPLIELEKVKESYLNLPVADRTKVQKNLASIQAYSGPESGEFSDELLVAIIYAQAFVTEKGLLCDIRFNLSVETELDRFIVALARVDLSKPICRGLLGVNIVDINEQEAKSAGLLQMYGAKVIKAQSPAADAGILPGDIIIEINGKKVTNVESVLVDLQQSMPGSPKMIKVLRNGSPLDFFFATAEFNAFDEPSNSLTGTKPRELVIFGMLLRSAETEVLLNLDKKFPGKYPAALVVQDVETCSQAYQSGVRKGDLIVRANIWAATLDTLQELLTKYKESEYTYFNVLREGNDNSVTPNELLVRVDADPETCGFVQGKPFLWSVLIKPMTGNLKVKFDGVEVGICESDSSKVCRFDLGWLSNNDKRVASLSVLASGGGWTYNFSLLRNGMPVDDRHCGVTGSTACDKGEWGEGEVYRAEYSLDGGVVVAVKEFYSSENSIAVEPKGGIEDPETGD